MRLHSPVLSKLCQFCLPQSSLWRAETVSVLQTCLMVSFMNLLQEISALHCTVDTVVAPRLGSSRDAGVHETMNCFHLSGKRGFSKKVSGYAYMSGKWGFSKICLLSTCHKIISDC
mmetsp:Transcript_623/g.1047  ORF Transcript_623/g.1047 Transcript_623/m.1047 type:complete len:116 (-) Transcript_623:938-1285(-)